MDEGPPSADHVLRPHHITLLIILSTVFKDLAIQKLPKPFALHIHRVLLNEVAEVGDWRLVRKCVLTAKQVAQPKAHKDLLIELCSGSSADQPECKKIIDEVNTLVCNILAI
jgi:anaphase-promoting complex subunit 5